MFVGQCAPGPSPQYLMKSSPLKPCFADEGAAVHGQSAQNQFPAAACLRTAPRRCRPPQGHPPPPPPVIVMVSPAQGERPWEGHLRALCQQSRSFSYRAGRPVCARRWGEERFAACSWRQRSLLCPSNPAAFSRTGCPLSPRPLSCLLGLLVHPSAPNSERQA